ncbi:arginine N-methyltransferase, type I [Trypanosoma rangeli]|uniref:Arginine N-methyltransferase, type I n=1 Tax=Trypanosoma rangeli TaxID=5698 RepID=A0A3R7MAM8_TRYRA|nr:arginine N-methyltransferase, type I [Trypanosoma rangeli]RNF02430.1 arginine N-methyltransferase, type I [Trypanosoma rangeli]|eukprot:RNF02430.1 arginine N-methyltransferase, type I [Trypanosoma rangeli]
MPSQQFVEEYDSHEPLQEQYFDAYTDLGVHRVMLADASRMSFYRQALTCEAVVRDRVVVDVGSGTGILSMWAARAGARHVFSIEASSLSLVQAQVIDDNDMSDRITLLSETVEAVVLEGVESFIAKHEGLLQGRGVSVIVSEWMGFYLLHEGMLPSVIRARNFFVEVNAKLGIACPIEMIPERATIWVAPMNCAAYYEERYREFWGNVGGFDLSRYGKMEFETQLESTNPLIDTVPSSCLLHEGAILAELDLTSVPEEAVASMCRPIHFSFGNSTAFQRHFSTAHPQGVVVDGFTVWFEVGFREWALSTSPWCPPTHWKQTTILLPATARAEQLVAFTSPEATSEVEVRLVATDTALRCYSIEFELK